jgi:uncharacterized protein YjbI with pentapeptide repeats
MPGMTDTDDKPVPSCAVKMTKSKQCGRPVHLAPDHDKQPVCLMHSKDPAKSNTQFQAEFERILAEVKGDGAVADFFGFVFPASNHKGKTFAPACNFVETIFTQLANFRGCTFAQRASFRGSKFTQGVDFRGAIFAQSASFQKATFDQDASFMGSAFTQDADFCFAAFNQDANFYRSTFNENVEFNGARFKNRAHFLGSKFTQCAHFKGAKFVQDAVFTRSTFGKEAGFDGATFLRGAEFRGARVFGSAKFRKTRFRHDVTEEYGLNFSDVQVEHPEQVEFYQTDLGQALFYNTDVSQVNFTLVTWRERGRKSWVQRWSLLRWVARRRTSRFCVFEEAVDLDRSETMRPLKGSADERNYGLIAEIYQQLKGNYDAKGDYWIAGHFHFGEMEMKRLHCRWRIRPLRWLSHHFSLVALYKYASAYGESYTLPLVWLTAVLMFFALMYPLTGLELSLPSGGGLIGYWNWSEFFQTHLLEHPSGWWGMLLHSLMTSLSVAGFQRELRYSPSYPWGRLMGLLEISLTTTLGALFALAIRRQFKRS